MGYQILQKSDQLLSAHKLLHWNFGRPTKSSHCWKFVFCDADSVRGNSMFFQTIVQQGFVARVIKSPRRSVLGTNIRTIATFLHSNVFKWRPLGALLPGGACCKSCFTPFLARHHTDSCVVVAKQCCFRTNYFVIFVTIVPYHIFFFFVHSWLCSLTCKILKCIDTAINVITICDHCLNFNSFSYLPFCCFLTPRQMFKCTGSLPWCTYQSPVYSATFFYTEWVILPCSRVSVGA